MSAAAQMQTINEDEFDESDMFGGGHRHKSEARRQDGDQLSLDGTDDSESDEMEDPSLHVSSPAAAARSPMLELPGAQSESAKSSTLNASLEEEAMVQYGDDPNTIAHRRYAAAGATTQPRAIAHSLPTTSSVRMGSSVPISIPFMGMGMAKFRKDDLAGGAPLPPFGGDFGGTDSPQYHGTFIPPHQMSQRDDFMFSFTGESPSVAIKRNKLRVRNAILKSTGFLEGGMGGLGIAGAASSPVPAAERGGGRVSASALSQALSSAQQ